MSNFPNPAQVGIPVPADNAPRPTIEEMKRAILDARGHAPVVAGCAAQAALEGLRDADFFVLVAYHALIMAQRYYDHEIYRLATQQPAHVIRAAD